MAVIYMTGWEPGPVAITNLSQGGAVSSSVVRGSWSTYSWFNSATGNVAATFTAAAGEFYFGFGFRSTESDTASRQIIRFWDPDGATVQVSLALSAARKLEAYRGAVGGVLLGTGSATLAINTWYYIEGHVIISDTVGDFDLRVDGVSDLSLAASQDRKAAGSTTSTCDRFMFGTSSSHSSYIDDFYVSAGCQLARHFVQR